MTVKELIQKLQGVDPGATILLGYVLDETILLESPANDEISSGSHPEVGSYVRLITPGYAACADMPAEEATP